MHAPDTNYAPENLLLTERGEQWLANFDDADKPVARLLVSKLILVSENEFERKLLGLIVEAGNKSTGPIGLYGVRELISGEHVFSATGNEISSTPRGVDIGSEGRLATMIRNLARENPTKFLNHPTWDEMRRVKCRRIFFVDDFIGSGKRVSDYIHDFYENATIKSWQSYKLIRASVIAYSGTSAGIARVKSTRMRPRVEIERSCPTISKEIRFKDNERSDVTELCKEYARRAKFRLPLGYADTGALMVFEHSCPNNCPQIFWGTNVRWAPLFFGKSISLEARKIFPPEIVRHTPVSILIEAGEKRIAQAAKDLVKRPLPAEWLAVLSLFSKGIRRVDAVESTTRLSHRDAAEVIEKCVASGLLTQSWRLTNFGARELQASRKLAIAKTDGLHKTPPDDYYPNSLRNRK